MNQLKDFVERNGDTFWVFMAALVSVVNRFVQRFVWSDPNAILFMFICYLLNFCADLYLLFQAKKLSWRLARSKMLTVFKNVAGALVLLYIATGMGKYSVVFFWLPQVMFGALLTVLITLIIKHASRLGIISTEIARYLDARISSTIIKDHDKDTPVADPVEGPVERPER